jgi:outer membrane immunogenic protein
MKTMLMSAVMAAALGSGAAMAADMPLKAPGTPIYESWTGIYLGGSAGIAVGNMKGFCATNGNCVSNDDDASWLGGGHVGIQWQTGQFVLGAEAKWIATDLNPFGNCPNGTSRCSIHIDDYWTAGGRLGYVVGNGLFYATAGYAQSKIDRDGVSKTTGIVQETWSATHSGWFIGSGAEFRLSNTGWVLGVEYNHVDFGSKSATGTLGEITSVKATVDSVQARLSYLLNWGGR